MLGTSWHLQLQSLEAVICNADSTIASFEEQLVVGVP
jgi:hypothetical protein